MHTCTAHHPPLETDADQVQRSLLDSLAQPELQSKPIEWIPAGHGTRAVLREHARAETAAGMTLDGLSRLAALGRRLRLEPEVVAFVLAEELS